MRVGSGVVLVTQGGGNAFFVVTGCWPIEFLDPVN